MRQVERQRWQSASDSFVGKKNGSGVVLGNGNQLIIHDGIATPQVHGLTHDVFVHDVLGEVAACADDLCPIIGVIVMSREDFDCLCFVHAPIISTGSGTLGAVL